MPSLSPGGSGPSDTEITKMSQVPGLAGLSLEVEAGNMEANKEVNERTSASDKSVGEK